MEPTRAVVQVTLLPGDDRPAEVRTYFLQDATVFEDVENVWEDSLPYSSLAPPTLLGTKLRLEVLGEFVEVSGKVHMISMIQEKTDG